MSRTARALALLIALVGAGCATPRSNEHDLERCGECHLREHGKWCFCFGFRPEQVVVLPRADAPFAPDEVRSALHVGTRWMYRWEGADEPLRVWVREVTAVDEHGPTLVECEEGQPEIGAPWRCLRSSSQASSWALLSGGGFPSDGTTVRPRVEVTVPAGTFTCTQYELATENGAVRYDYSAALPGVLVRYEVIATDADGAPRSRGRLELLDYHPPP
ncbi:MAG: hypothetical protein M9894_21250 [Planctomycetes bacterium]|nr:hypothetical protein [Planctomycetota bacterium]